MGFKTLWNSLLAKCQPSKGIAWKSHELSASVHSHVSTCLKVLPLKQFCRHHFPPSKRKIWERTSHESTLHFLIPFWRIRKMGANCWGQSLYDKNIRSLFPCETIRVARNWSPYLRFIAKPILMVLRFQTDETCERLVIFRAEHG